MPRGENVWDDGAIDETPKRVSPLIELGVTGLKRTCGYIDEEFLPQLSAGARPSAIYREMSRERPDRRRAAVRHRPAAPPDRVAGGGGEQLPGGQAGLRVRRAVHGRHVPLLVGHDLRGHDHADLRLVLPRDRLQEADRALGEGPQAQVQVHGRQDRLAQDPDPLPGDPKRWIFDTSGGVQGIVQLAPPYYQNVTLPIEKCLLFRTTTVKGNPEGRSMLRNAYRPWYMKKRIEEFEAIGVERDLAGLPVGKVPASTSTPRWDRRREDGARLPAHGAGRPPGRAGGHHPADRVRPGDQAAAVRLRAAERWWIQAVRHLRDHPALRAADADDRAGRLHPGRARGQRWAPTPCTPTRPACSGPR